MHVVQVPLNSDEHAALIALARKERRDPRAQAAILIRQRLESAGLLTGDDFDPFYPLAAPVKKELLRLLREEPDVASDVLAEKLAARLALVGAPLIRPPVMVDLICEARRLISAAPANA